jgi:hypothetical protein
VCLADDAAGSASPDDLETDAMSETNEQSRNESSGNAGSSASPALDFTTVVLSIRQSALLMMGLVTEGEGADAATDPAGARYQIELLELLEKKTAGNLDDDENRLLRAVLYELRVAWVEQRSGKSAV